MAFIIIYNELEQRKGVPRKPPSGGMILEQLMTALDSTFPSSNA